MTTGSKPRPAPVPHSPSSAMSASFSSTTRTAERLAQGASRCRRPSSPGRVYGLWIVPRTGSTGPAQPMPTPSRSRAVHPVSASDARHRLGDPPDSGSEPSLGLRRDRGLAQRCSPAPLDRRRPRSSFRRCRCPPPARARHRAPAQSPPAGLAVAEDGHVGVQPQEGGRTARGHGAAHHPPERRGLVPSGDEEQDRLRPQDVARGPA